MKLVQLSPLLFSFSLAACGDGAAVPIDAPVAADAPAVLKSVEVTLRNPPADLGAAGVAFAYQDGDGAWKKATAPVGDKITFQVANDKYGFGVACVTGTNHIVSLTYGTQSAEPKPVVDAGGCANSTEVSLPGTINGMTQTVGNRFHNVSFGPYSLDYSTATGELSAPFTLKVPLTTADIILSRSDANDVVDRYGIERNVTVGAAPLAKTFDFNAMAAPQQVPQPAPATGRSSFESVFLTATSLHTITSFAPPFFIVAPPVAQRLPTDKFGAQLTNTSPSGDSRVSILNITATPEPVTLPTNLIPPISTAMVGNAQVRASWDQVTNSNGTYGGFASVDCGNACSYNVFAVFSPSWRGTSRNVSWTTPELAIWGINATPNNAKYRMSISVQLETGTFPAVGYSFESHSRRVDTTQALQSKTADASFADIMRRRCHGRFALPAICDAR